jgi:hypothetical protein
MVRRPVPFTTVYGFTRTGEETWNYLVEPTSPIAYVWVNMISSSTLHELQQAERELAATGARALIIDLRELQNDGVMRQARLVADGLLEKGLMWKERQANRPTAELQADRECLFRGWPMAVLTDGATRDTGAAAIVAALQDNHRAVVVGAPSDAKPFLTTDIDLPGNLGGVVLRSGRIERARASAPWPPEPDEAVEMVGAVQQTVHHWLWEKQLPELPGGKKDTAPRDPQLARAVELLKTALKKDTTAQEKEKARNAG